MSISDPLKSLPVVHHFYPINPQTALQQQSAVYNTPDYPLVAPILPASSSQPFRDANPNSNKRRRIQEVDSEAQYPGGNSTTKDVRHRHVEFLQEPSESLTICLGPRQQRRIPYVELPVHRSIDLTLYRPVSLASPATQLLLGWGRHRSRARSVSQISFGESAFSVSSPDPSTGSEYLYPGDSIATGEREKVFKGKKAKSGMKVRSLGVHEDDATTCHQCRRKTTKEKMRCRRLRPDGTVCPYLFCEYCIEVRYDELFNQSHPTWHCPRCRGICNCSICLRKAGFGYILDGSMSEQFTGTQGRLSVGKNRFRSGAKRGNQVDGEQSRVSVRVWLARKGIALGTEVWMVERRRQGVRYVVGKSPLPLDVPSPYMEARFNPTIAACTEYIDEDSDPTDEDTDKTSLCGGDVTAIPSGPLTLNHSDATAMSSTQEMDSNRKSLLEDMQPHSCALNGAAATETYEETDSHTLPLPHPPVDTSALPISSEDLPGLCSSLTHGTRLIIGKPLPKSIGSKKNLKTPKIKKRKVTKPKRHVDVDDSDSDYDASSQQNHGLPAIRVGRHKRSNSGLQTRTVQDEGSEEENDRIRGSSPISDIFYSPLSADEIYSPPPTEPVLVPTEYYAPFKLDGTIAQGSQAQFGHTYWSFNSVTPHDHRHELNNGGRQGSSSSLLMSTPLYSNNEQHPYPQFSLGDAGPVGPSAIGSTSAPTSRIAAHQSPSESTSLSDSHTPHDYLNPQAHTQARDVDAYTAPGLAAFTALDEPWPPIGMDQYPNLEIDMSPLQVEGITHGVDIALHKRQWDQL